MVTIEDNFIRGYFVAAQFAMETDLVPQETRLFGLEYQIIFSPPNSQLEKDLSVYEATGHRKFLITINNQIDPLLQRRILFHELVETYLRRYHGSDYYDANQQARSLESKFCSE